jgi:uncharacterized membrane protein YkoI
VIITRKEVKKMNVKKLLAMMLVFSFLVTVGVMQIAAQSNNTENDLDQDQLEMSEPSYQGSIIVDGSEYDSISEQEEGNALASLATITADQAKQFAEEAVNGTEKASKVELDNENGNLVYEVTIGNQEVKIDAGDGSVLHIENTDIEKD